MKLNWGTSIAIFYGLFVIVMVGAVIKASQLGVPLVQDEYYQADINYEEFRTKRQNALKLEEGPKVMVKHQTGQVVVDFPDQKGIKGELQLYRPSQTGVDHIMPITVNDSGLMIIPLEKIQKGRWTIKLDWTSSDVGYFWEDDIVI